MAHILSFEQAPPISAPFRFFLTAPIFALLAGLLLAIEGGNVLISRWSPVTLAFTHLLAVGFVLQVMLGALIQVLPVVASVSWRHPVGVARFVHVLLCCGTLSLVGGFLTQIPEAFIAAVALLGGALAVFVFCAVRAPAAMPVMSLATPTISGIRFALVGLCILFVLGALLAGALAGLWSPSWLSFIDLTILHVNWAFAGWGLVLFAAVAYVVVPMFQITPPYPRRFAEFFAGTLLVSLVLLSATVLQASELLVGVVQTVIVALAASFCGITITLQSRSKRTRKDATYHFWHVAVISGFAACLLMFAVRLFPDLAAWEALPLLIGALLLIGGFMSVIIGMLYKIIPFLVWLHLQNRGLGKIVAPNMKHVLAEVHMRLHLHLHAGSGVLLIAAILWPEFFAHSSGIGLALAAAYLMRNLLACVGVFRREAARIDERLAQLAAAEEITVAA